MRIVQRVGRIDRIGSTEAKYVHNFYLDGDIEAAIKLLERLQAKINDIALIVGKENNILDPNENQVLERAGVETEKTIGELEVEEIEESLRESRAVEDINELDDTRTNPLLREAGSDETAAFERYLLKDELNEEYGLDASDFEFAEEYFDTLPGEREFLYTNTVGDSGPRPGVFGLVHLWFDDEDAPLGRVRRAFYYKSFGDDVKERPVRMLSFAPDVQGAELADEDEVARVLSDREAIEDLVERRLAEIRETQVEGAFLQGGEHSKEQETLLSFCRQYVEARHGDEPAAGEDETVRERARALRERRADVGLKNTDEDRILRERFRHSDEYDALTEWPVTEALDELEGFLNEYVAESAEYQETLVGESEVRARLICWGVVGS